MNRRTFLAAAAVTALAPPLPAFAQPPRTRWVVRGSEGFDALSFLSPLSGDPFYKQYYEAAVAEFEPLMPPAAMATLRAIKQQAAAADILLSPFLDLRFSAGPDATIGDLLSSMDQAERVLRPPLQASSYWAEESWAIFMQARPALRMVLEAMREAGFAAFRARRFDPKAAERLPALRQRLTHIDVVAEVERFTGRTLDPTVEVVLLEFCKPHGIKVLGQKFLSAIDWDDDIVIRTAGHELLHPPIDMNGPVGVSALAILGRDPLIRRIVAEHNRSFGYNSLEGLFDEDLASAVDQLVAERLGFARAPRERWNDVDDGMHVMTAGLYRLMHETGYARTGGNLEAWLRTLIAAGGLEPARLHAAASRVLGRPADRLWPLPPAGERG